MAAVPSVLLWWSTCDEELVLEPLPEFVDDHNVSAEVVTSTQNEDYFDVLKSPARKKFCKEKITKQEALDAVEQAASYAEAVSNILKQLADQTLSNVSEDDMAALELKQGVLKVRLTRLINDVKTRKFRHQQSNNPEILEATFCKREDFSFLDHISSSLDTSSESLEDTEQNVSSAPVYRKKLGNLKDWKYVLERTKGSYEAIQQDAIQQGVSVTQLLALHSYRENYSTNKKMAHLQKLIYEDKDLTNKASMSTEMALHIVERLRFKD
jgi:hypothetical protein